MNNIKQKWTADQIRKTFIDFFTKKGHVHRPSSSLIPHGDNTVLFSNSGMMQFKKMFTGEQEPIGSIVTCQKCLRVGGKHNDLENVGYTKRHHTFFEMLGNFSFGSEGSYFKRGAIEFAWEIITQEFKIPKDKLYVTYFHEDLETMDIWKNVIGVSEDRIIPIDTQDNFWTMGAVGPCGPCTEIFYDHGEEYDGGLPGQPDADGDRYIEIWNIVFMQFEQHEGGERTPLKNACIDTGMGLERIAAVLSGTNDNYRTPIFEPLMMRIADDMKLKYAALPDEIDKSCRVVADHLRAIAFLIADGILPSNEGRGYVLRRIMRRMMRHFGKICEYSKKSDKVDNDRIEKSDRNNYLESMSDFNMNDYDDILRDLILFVLDDMKGNYPELIRAKEHILHNTIDECKKFGDALKNGIRQLNKILEKYLVDKKKLRDEGSERIVLSGKDAFYLYDTYGFPIDLTQDILREMNIDADISGFEIEMRSQRERAKANAQEYFSIDSKSMWSDIGRRVGQTKFIGYNSHAAKAKIVQLILNGECAEIVDFSLLNSDSELMIILDQTVFYAESGGQCADSGYIIPNMHDNSGKENAISMLFVDDVQKYAEGIFAHHVDLKSTREKIDAEMIVRCDQGVFCYIDSEKRWRTAANHSAAHILHSALREVLGEHVMQRGSSVNDCRLRFDFSHSKPISHDEMLAIEDIVRKNIQENHDVNVGNCGYQEALKNGAIGLFEEKYGDEVRTIRIGNSYELCGGTHIDFSGRIEEFAIIHESNIASGVRRIEAYTGKRAQDAIQARGQFAGKLRCSVDHIDERINDLLRSSKEWDNLQLQKRIDGIVNKAMLFGAYGGGGMAEICYCRFNSDAASKKDFDRDFQQIFKLIQQRTKKLAKSLILCCANDKLDAMSIQMAASRELHDGKINNANDIESVGELLRKISGYIASDDRKVDIEVNNKDDAGATDIPVIRNFSIYEHSNGIASAHFGSFSIYAKEKIDKANHDRIVEFLKARYDKS